VKRPRLPVSLCLANCRRRQSLNPGRRTRPQFRTVAALTARPVGAGPVTALALTCWLGGQGRFSSSRKAVRFAGLDITVYSSDRKGPPGRLSRQGPPLRWAVYEAGKTHARSTAPDHAYYAAVKEGTVASAPPCPKPARSSGRPAGS
jgi:transposase